MNEFMHLIIFTAVRDQ